MSPNRTIARLLAAAVLLALSAAGLHAEPAVATAHVNVRSGPGAGFAVVDTLTPGETVEMTECQPSGWCYITHDGPDGWVSSAYLTAGPGVGRPGPDCSLRLTIGPDGPRFEVVCGDGPGPGPGPGPDPTPPATHRACFFDGPNFTGDSFCRSVGLYNTLPAAANNRISSVRLYGAARVRLCDRQNMQPFCRDVTSSEAHLGGFLNDRVSSLRVYTGVLPPKKQACLFDDAHYTGPYMCFGVGTHALPPAARDRATSVRLFGGAAVRLSQSVTYGVGGARHLTSSVPALGPGWNNATKSLRVE